MPGRIIQSIQQAGTNNPLIMLDEIDKVGADFRGDPSSALARGAGPGTELFFSRQLSRRHVRSVERDVHDDGEHARHDSARRCAIEWRSSGWPATPKKRSARSRAATHSEADGREWHHGARSDISAASALKAIIQQYTHEAGLAAIRTRDRAHLSQGRAPRRRRERCARSRNCTRTCTSFSAFRTFIPEEVLKKDQIGVATGLAWTPGGRRRAVHRSLLTAGKGKLVLTGQLGEVMRESAQAAYS